MTTYKTTYGTYLRVGANMVAFKPDSNRTNCSVCASVHIKADSRTNALIDRFLSDRHVDWATQAAVVVNLHYEYEQDVLWDIEQEILHQQEARETARAWALRKEEAWS